MDQGRPGGAWFVVPVHLAGLALDHAHPRLDLAEFIDAGVHRVREHPQHAAIRELEYRSARVENRARPAGCSPVRYLLKDLEHGLLHAAIRIELDLARGPHIANRRAKHEPGGHLA